MITEIIHSFEFLEENRNQIMLSDSDNIRLNPKTNTIELKANDNDEYPINGNYYIESWYLEA
ncbi:MAG: hypothetical protein ABIA04_16450 [Pseudomonadota bacterium]